MHVVHKHVQSIWGAQNSKGGQLRKNIFSKGSWLVEGRTVTKEKKKKTLRISGLEELVRPAGRIFFF